MTKELFSPIIKALTAATVLLVLISANSMMNYTYAATKNTPIQNVTNQHALLVTTAATTCKIKCTIGQIRLVMLAGFVKAVL